MKPERIGLPGSVAVIGLVYLLALAFAPSPGLSAQTGMPNVRSGMGHEDCVASTTTPIPAAGFPQLRHPGGADAMLKPAHARNSRKLENRWTGTSPTNGTRRLTVF